MLDPRNPSDPTLLAKNYKQGDLVWHVNWETHGIIIEVRKTEYRVWWHRYRSWGLQVCWDEFMRPLNANTTKI